MAFKNFNIIVKNSILLSRIREKTQVGLEPKYQTSFAAKDQQDNTLYAKNYARIQGLCKVCVNFVRDKVNTVTGEHCSLGICDK